MFGRGVSSKGILLRIHNTGIFFWQKKGWERKWLFFLITIAFSLHIFICMIFFQSYACTSVFEESPRRVSSYRAITAEESEVEKRKGFSFLITNAFSLHIHLYDFPPALCTCPLTPLSMKLQSVTGLSTNFMRGRNSLLMDMGKLE